MIDATDARENGLFLLMGQVHIFPVALAQGVEFYGRFQKGKGALVRLQGLIKRGRVKMQVGQGGPVAVVVEEFAKFPQLADLLLAEVQCCGCCTGCIVEVVAKGSGHGPGTKAAAQELIDNQRGAGLGCRVDMGGQPGVCRDFAGKVVIDVEDVTACRQLLFQCHTVFVQGDVKDGQLPLITVFDLAEEVEVGVKLYFILQHLQ